MNHSQASKYPSALSAKRKIATDTETATAAETTTDTETATGTEIATGTGEEIGEGAGVTHGELAATKMANEDQGDAKEMANSEKLAAANSPTTGTNPAISIIIPVYNVEKWLARAIKSLQEQTFSNFEVFLVDDGSTDESGRICDELAGHDARIKVIHQKNAGAAAARNVAITRATGEFLYFMDGDDWAEPDMLAHLYEFAHKNNLDLVIAGFYIDTYYTEEKFYQELRTAPNVIYKNAADFRAHAHELFDAQLLYAPWNKLYRRSYLAKNNIEFPATFWDDLPFNLSVVRDIERVGCINERFYHFLRARAESENTKYRSDMYGKREEEHSWLVELYEHWDLHTPEVEEFLARRYVERLVGCVENVTNKSCRLSTQEKRAEIARMISTPCAQDALLKAKPHSTMMRIMLFPLRHKNVWLTYAEGSFISWVRKHFLHLFAHLKANR